MALRLIPGGPFAFYAILVVDQPRKRQCRESGLPFSFAFFAFLCETGFVMTKADLLKALEKVPDHARIYYIDRRELGAQTRIRYHDGELCELRRVKVQSTSFGAVNVVVFGETVREVLVDAKELKVILT